MARPGRTGSRATPTRTARSFRAEAWVVAAALFSTAGDAQARQPELTVHAPPAMEATAQRVRRIEVVSLERSLAAAGLPMPERISITLIARDDRRAQHTPDWVVGLATGTSNVVIFPDRIGPYPHDSLEAVVRHEVVHLALNMRAAGRPLPRWFHEGTAVTVASGWKARDEMRLLLAALDPPSMADIGRLFRSEAYPDTAQAYLLAAALVDHIRQHHGGASAGTIAGHVAAGLPFDRAFEAATGETVDDAAARAWQGHRTVSQWFLVITSPSTVWSLILALAAVAFVSRVRRRRARRRRWDEEDEVQTESEDLDDGRMSAVKAVHPRVSYADLERMPEDGRRYELYDGEVFVVPAPLARHQVTQQNIVQLLAAYGRQTGGLVIESPIDIVFSDYDVLQPDVVFFSAARRHLIDLDRVIRDAPDLCVEVLSPSTAATDRGKKMQMFARYGVSEYWIVDPRTATIELYELKKGEYVLRTTASGDILVTSSVVPGCSFHAGSVFP